MNIDEIQFADAYEMPLLHPTARTPLRTQTGEAMYIRVLRADAPPLRALQARWRNELLRQPGTRLTAEQLDARVTEQLVAATVGWLIEGAAGPIPYSPEAVRRLYADPAKAWIVEQVDRAMGAKELYLGEPSMA